VEADPLHLGLKGIPEALRPSKYLLPAIDELKLNPQLQNRYVYSQNNPVHFIDPLGLGTECLDEKCAQEKWNNFLKCSYTAASKAIPIIGYGCSYICETAGPSACAICLGIVIKDAAVIVGACYYSEYKAQLHKCKREQ
jgi:hypothetical protein